MSFTTSTLIHQFLEASGAPASGEVEFTLATTLTNGGVTVVGGTSQVVALDASGNLTTTLVSTEDPGTACEGQPLWRADERVSGAPPRSVFLQVPSGGGTYDYAALTQTPSDFG